MGNYIPDYNDLYAMHEARQERELRKYPKCNFCNEHITEEKLYAIDGKHFHEDCFNGECLKDTDDFMED